MEPITMMLLAAGGITALFAAKKAKQKKAEQEADVPLVDPPVEGTEIVLSQGTTPPMLSSIHLRWKMVGPTSRQANAPNRWKVITRVLEAPPGAGVVPFGPKRVVTTGDPALDYAKRAIAGRGTSVFQALLPFATDEGKVFINRGKVLWAGHRYLAFRLVSSFLDAFRPEVLTGVAFPTAEEIDNAAMKAFNMVALQKLAKDHPERAALPYQPTIEPEPGFHWVRGPQVAMTSEDVPIYMWKQWPESGV